MKYKLLSIKFNCSPSTLMEIKLRLFNKKLLIFWGKYIYISKKDYFKWFPNFIIPHRMKNETWYQFQFLDYRLDFILKHIE